MIAFEKSVGAVIFRREDGNIKFLLLNYGKTKSGKYHWGFAKGHMEENETEEETMRREVLEETGISDLNLISGFRDKNRHFYRAYGEEREKRKKSGRKTLVAKQVAYLLAETKSEKINLSQEHIDFAWLPFGESKKRLTYKISQKTLEKARLFLEKNNSV